jgi:hypothetical protein
MKRKQILSLACVLTAIVFLSSCATLKVTEDYDKDANFKLYKSFAIDVLKTPATVNQLNQTRVINAVRAEMIKKGFTENTSTPDMVVSITLIFKDEKSVTASTNYYGGYGYGGMYRPYGWGGGMASGHTTYNVDNYINGSLIIGVADTKTKNLLWEGIGNKDLEDKIKDPDTTIPEVVAKIMYGFPPGSTAKK